MSEQLVSLREILQGPFERLSSDSEVFEREGMRVKVMSRETLVELKRRRGFPQDLADIEAIALLDRLEE